MSKVIIYKTPENTVSVIHPASEWADNLEELAKTDVPTGLKYKIIDFADLPNRDFRDAWEVDEAELTDGVGS
jgi:hypothetical protein